MSFNLLYSNKIIFFNFSKMHAFKHFLPFFFFFKGRIHSLQINLGERAVYGYTDRNAMQDTIWSERRACPISV